MGCDRLSGLPDSLLTQILSYLPFKDTAKTSVLSKRWEFLWLEVSGLVLNANDFLPSHGKPLLSFIDRFWKLNHGLCLKTLKIKYQKTNGALSFDCSKSVMEWIAEVIHLGVQHLEIEDITSAIKRNVLPMYRRLVVEKQMYDLRRKVDCMPKYMYVSKTLVSLKLVNVGLEDPKFDVSLPRLKNMHLENIDYMGGDGILIIQRLISASNVLEDLSMDIPVLKKPKEIAIPPWPWPGQVSSHLPLPRSRKVSSFWTNVPQCLSSTLEYVKLNKLVMKETGIKLVNYFLENSAVLKKLTLSLTDSHDTNNQDAESYKKLLTSTKLSPRCQVFVC